MSSSGKRLQRATGAGTQSSSGARTNSDEIRVYGVNACLALFAHRPQAIRKVYLVETRIIALKSVLAWCVKHRLGYRVVESADLDKLTQTQHHEGVCFDVIRRAPFTLGQLLDRIPVPPQPALLIWFEGVGNPHNFGAVLRSAAHFGAAGLIISPDSALSLSGAAMRVAEGGAEAVPVAQAAPNEDVAGALHAAGFALAAAVPRDGANLYKSKFPPRLALIFGAEGAGLTRQLSARADLQLTVPGSGAVESLNIAASAAVLFGEFYRRYADRAGR